MQRSRGVKRKDQLERSICHKYLSFLSLFSFYVYMFTYLFDYTFLLDLDPCTDVTCHYHCLCKAFGPNDARCVAEDTCPSYQEPVCSSNGTTYDNECLFRQEMCLQRLNFSVQHPGSCEGQTDNNLLCIKNKSTDHVDDENDNDDDDVIDQCTAK